MLILLRTADARIAAQMTATLAEAGLRLVVELPATPPNAPDAAYQDDQGNLGDQGDQGDPHDNPHAEPTTGAAAPAVPGPPAPEPDALVADLDLLAPPLHAGHPDAAQPVPHSGNTFSVPPGIPLGVPLILLHTATARMEQHRVRAAGLPASARLLRAPFAAGALVAALRAAGLTTPPGRGPLAAGVLALGDIVFDPATGRATRDFRPLTLHPQERLLLELLLRRAGTVVHRADIARWCLDYAASPGGNAPHAHQVDVLVSRLRRTLKRALAPNAVNGTRLRTVRGVGYRLETD